MDAYELGSALQGVWETGWHVTEAFTQDGSWQSKPTLWLRRLEAYGHPLLPLLWRASYVLSSSTFSCTALGHREGARDTCIPGSQYWPQQLEQLATSCPDSKGTGQVVGRSFCRTFPITRFWKTTLEDFRRTKNH